ncbi:MULTISPECIES: hypothetical protein [Clostridium]|uniref:hypothetical protein n=1 Tax=Clostridium TaxID=1485 RepID=UPI00069FC21E|nr:MULTISPECIES: hypothetical protein [Clostridium]KOF58199.1 hypothetical protein AGR56_00525 [Clostridium sp. DMHC 10]MCD2346630.1 hypothetical protein [Clostridium guangxiense]
MEDRAVLMSYNDITFTDEEIEKYECTKVKDDILKRMKNKVNSIYVRGNFDDGLSKVEEQFYEDENVQCIFAAESYGVRETKILVGFTGPSSFAAGIWNNWGTKTIVILTNKRVFVAYANDVYGFLKIKNYKFGEIEFIKNIKYRGKDNVLIIKPVNEKEIKMNIYNDKHIKTLNYIKDTVKVYNERKKFTNNDIALIIEIAIFLFLGAALVANLL